MQFANLPCLDSQAKSPDVDSPNQTKNTINDHSQYKQYSFNVFTLGLASKW